MAIDTDSGAEVPEEEPSPAMIEAGAEALYAKDWEVLPKNLYDGHFPFEPEETKNYWRSLARAGFIAMKRARRNDKQWERLRQSNARVRDADAKRLESMIPRKNE